LIFILVNTISRVASSFSLHQGMAFTSSFLFRKIFV
jgi:hypothetical protein